MNLQLEQWDGWAEEMEEVVVMDMDEDAVVTPLAQATIQQTVLEARMRDSAQRQIRRNRMTSEQADAARERDRIQHRDRRLLMSDRQDRRTPAVLQRERLSELHSRGLHDPFFIPTAEGLHASYQHCTASALLKLHFDNNYHGYRNCFRLMVSQIRNMDEITVSERLSPFVILILLSFDAMFTGRP